jgi:hypothetical protein
MYRYSGGVRSRQADCRTVDQLLEKTANRSKRRVDIMGTLSRQPGVSLRGADPVSPTIFNIVVDAVVRQWLSQVCSNAVVMDGLDYEVGEKCVLFYADHGLVGAMDKDWVQESFDTLINLFERVGLRTNTQKTKAMICTLGHISGRQSDYVYERRMTGNEDIFQTRQQRRVTCSIYKRSFAHSSLARTYTSAGATRGDHNERAT